MFLAIGWGSVSTVYVIIESYLWLYSVDTTAVLYSLNAVIFFLVTREFRNAAVLGGMVENSPKRPDDYSKFLGSSRKANGLSQGNDVSL